MVPAQSKVIIFCGKGGVGKTTLSLSLALRMAEGGKRVVVVSSHPLPELAVAVSLEGMSEAMPEAARNLFVVHIEPRELLAELVRAKTGRVNGHLIALLTVMKGLPLTYSKDMQEDKEAVFDAAETLDLSLAAMTGMVRDMAVDARAMAKAAGSGHSTATDLADWLVRRLGLPFREAHHVTGRVVALAEQRKT